MLVVLLAVFLVHIMIAKNTIANNVSLNLVIVVFQSHIRNSEHKCNSSGGDNTTVVSE